VGRTTKIFPILSIIDRMFGVPRLDPISGQLEQPELRWAHKVRGFPDMDEELDEVAHLDLNIIGDLRTYVKEQVRIIILCCNARMAERPFYNKA
jgi:hypothetical protein